MLSNHFSLFSCKEGSKQQTISYPTITKYFRSHIYSYLLVLELFCIATFSKKKEREQKQTYDAIGGRSGT